MTQMRYTEAPELPPGACFRCLVGAGEKRDYFVDTGVSYDFEGQVYICNMCLVDFVKMMPDQVTLEQYEGAVSENEALCQELEEARLILDSLYKFGIDVDRILERMKDDGGTTPDDDDEVVDDNGDAGDDDPIVVSPLTLFDFTAT
jgi:hypothetical protein